MAVIHENILKSCKIAHKSDAYETFLLISWTHCCINVCVHMFICMWKDLVGTFISLMIFFFRVRIIWNELASFRMRDNLYSMLYTMFFMVTLYWWSSGGEEKAGMLACTDLRKDWWWGFNRGQHQGWWQFCACSSSSRLQNWAGLKTSRRLMCWWKITDLLADSASSPLLTSCCTSILFSFCFLAETLVGTLLFNSIEFNGCCE